MTDRPSHRSRREAALVANLKAREAEIERLRLAIARALTYLPDRSDVAEDLLSKALEESDERRNQPGVR